MTTKIPIGVMILILDSLTSIDVNQMSAMLSIGEELEKELTLLLNETVNDDQFRMWAINELQGV